MPAVLVGGDRRQVVARVRVLVFAAGEGGGVR